MTATGNLQLVRERGWCMGLGNLLRKENGNGWGSRRWFSQSLMWLVIMNGFLAVTLFVMPIIIRNSAGAAEVETFTADLTAIGTQIFFQMGAVALGIGMIITAQDVFIGERQSGVAQWILSKPVSRPAYYLSKLIASTWVMLVMMVGVPAVAGYLIITSVSSAPLPWVSFSLATGGLVLHTLFYLTLTLMLGIFFEKRSKVLGISLGMLMGGMVLPNAIGVRASAVTPWLLPQILSVMARGVSLPTTGLYALPFFVTAIWSMVFVLASLWKLGRMEF